MEAWVDTVAKNAHDEMDFHPFIFIQNREMVKEQG